MLIEVDDGSVYAEVDGEALMLMCQENQEWPSPMATLFLNAEQVDELIRGLQDARRNMRIEVAREVD